ncbi:uncharacterized protein B0J16DRAFT_379570 [Fusarium flagelliforme]|nr:uncharacterized protein B0J16DRAFT_379570 [Fusarium flagelliforme]KAH7199123.1 hypothetical protein B0J16DRAFT_379570 [Fusarium flagelliforme]
MAPEKPSNKMSKKRQTLPPNNPKPGKVQKVASKAKKPKRERDGMYWTPYDPAKAEFVTGHRFSASGRALLTVKTQEREDDVTISEFNLGAGRGEREELILRYWLELDMKENPDKAQEENRDHRTAVTGRDTYHLQDIVNHRRLKKGKSNGKLVFDVTYQGYPHNEIGEKTMDEVLDMRPKIVDRYFKKKGIALPRQHANRVANDPDTSDDDDETDDKMGDDEHPDEANEESNHCQDAEGEEAMEDEAGGTEDVIEVPDSQAQGEERMEVDEAGATKDIVEVPDSQAQAN